MIKVEVSSPQFIARAHRNHRLVSHTRLRLCKDRAKFITLGQENYFRNFRPDAQQTYDPCNTELIGSAHACLRARKSPVAQRGVAQSNLLRVKQPSALQTSIFEEM